MGNFTTKNETLNTSILRELLGFILLKDTFRIGEYFGANNSIFIISQFKRSFRRASSYQIGKMKAKSEHRMSIE